MQTRLLSHDSHELVTWYRGVRRDLPWRMNRDPYRIWISEIMLQQTTVAAVVPFYERFLKRFPTLADLASAPLADVLEHWAGLGYYSRARNLHRAASLLNESGFPRTHQQLLLMPGFGPYTARAVASLAFGERTGVLDGNVIRVLSRSFGIDEEWWKPRGRERLQTLADQLAQNEDPSDLNQALMELGATVCTPKSPSCLLCPWAKSCVARLDNAIETLPRKRPRRSREIWAWNPTLVVKTNSVLLIPNSYAPFLKGHWILPGIAQRLENVPRKFDFRGAVTHHDIFVTITREVKLRALSLPAEHKWVPLSAIKREVPSALIRKAIESCE